MNARVSNLDTTSRDEALAGLAEIRLLTVDGTDFRRVGVLALDGVITLRGEVKTESERKHAAAVVRKVDGVYGVNNQLQVVREGPGPSSTDAPSHGARVALRSHQAFDRVVGVETAGQILENSSSDLIPKAEGVQ